MATRFYLCGADVGDFPKPTPSASSPWNAASTSRSRIYPFKLGYGVANSTAFVSNGATAPWNEQAFQVISQPLAAQTISGTGKGQLTCFENADIDACAAVQVRVVSYDGSTVRGTLLSYFPSSLTSEFARTIANRHFPPETTLSSVDVQEWDRIVIDYGARIFKAYASEAFLLRLHDGATDDLPEDETETEYGSHSAWFEFSQDLEFSDMVAASTVRGEFEYGEDPSIRAYSARGAFEYDEEPRLLVYAVRGQFEYVLGTTSVSTSASSSVSTSASSSVSSSASTSASSSLTSSNSTSMSTSGSTSRSSSQSTSASSSLTTSNSTSTSASSSLTTSASSSLTSSTITPPPLLPPFTFESRLAEEPPSVRCVRLNNAGDFRENPIVAGAAFRIYYHKHSSEEQFRQCWITVDGEVFADLTDRCFEESTYAYVDVVAGTDLESGAPPVLNVIHFSTSFDTTKVGTWVADVQAVSVITMDGYDGRSANNPYVYRPAT
jgi:hypothetical protein